MPVNINFGKVDAALKSAAEDVFNQGYQAGWDDAVAKVMAAFGLHTQDDGADDSKGADLLVRRGDGVMTVVQAKDRSQRARRGAVDEALERALEAHPGMTQDEVEAAALAIDPTISAKSVYNKLRHWENLGRKFRRRNDRWYRIADLPSDLPIRRDGVLHTPEQREAPV